MNVLETPIWRLTPDEIESLPKQEQQWVRNALGEMRADGTLAMLHANPPDTRYQTVYDGRWCLRPIEIAPLDIETKMTEILGRWKEEFESKTEARFIAILDKRALTPPERAES